MTPGPVSDSSPGPQDHEVLSCAFCGHSYEGDRPLDRTQLTQHVRQCGQHPARELVQFLDALASSLTTAEHLRAGRLTMEPEDETMRNAQLAKGFRERLNYLRERWAKLDSTEGDRPLSREELTEHVMECEEHPLASTRSACSAELLATVMAVVGRLTLQSQEDAQALLEEIEHRDEARARAHQLDLNFARLAKNVLALKRDREKTYEAEAVRQRTLDKILRWIAATEVDYTCMAVSTCPRTSCRGVMRLLRDSNPMTAVCGACGKTLEMEP